MKDGLDRVDNDYRSTQLHRDWASRIRYVMQALAVVAMLAATAFPALAQLQELGRPDEPARIVPPEGPAWLLYERGLHAWDAGLHGEALRFFSEAAERGSPFPEAESMIGDVYQFDAENDLAERQYCRALEQRGAANVPDHTIATLYKLAELYDKQSRFLKVEEVYRVIIDVVAETDDVGRAQTASLTNAMTRVFVDFGLDRVLVLYRLANPRIIDAQRGLASFYFRDGRDQQALDYSILATVNILSEAARAIRRRNPAYEFTTVIDLIGRSSQRPLAHVEEYLEESGIYETLYHLAASAYRLGEESRAFEVWRLLSITAQAGTWRMRATQQLAAPSLTREPVESAAEPSPEVVCPVAELAEEDRGSRVRTR